jgi:hypothetical protein
MVAPFPRFLGVFMLCCRLYHMTSSFFSGRDLADPWPAAIPACTLSTHCWGGVASPYSSCQFPPLVGLGLRVAFRRVLPQLLTPERGHVQVAPGTHKRLVAAIVDEVGAEHPVPAASERAAEATSESMAIGQYGRA